MSIALDSQFVTNKFFYAFYTYKQESVNFIARFIHQENSGGLTSRGDLSSEGTDSRKQREHGAVDSLPGPRVVRIWKSQPVFMRFHYGGKSDCLGYMIEPNAGLIRRFIHWTRRACKLCRAAACVTV